MKEGEYNLQYKLKKSFNFFPIEVYMYKYLAEFLGTLFLVYVIIATANPLAAGAALALAILMTANISGGHINPAVTIAMAVAGKIDVNEIIPYVLAQILGGLVAIQIFIRYKI
jgi:glycerol uptake facilitator-like aquaporin